MLEEYIDNLIDITDLICNNDNIDEFGYFKTPNGYLGYISKCCWSDAVLIINEEKRETLLICDGCNRIIAKIKKITWYLGEGYLKIDRG